jgi:hypothetical protein
MLEVRGGAFFTEAGFFAFTAGPAGGVPAARLLVAPTFLFPVAFARGFGGAAFRLVFFAARLAAAVRAAVFAFGRAAVFRAGLDFFLDEAAFAVPLALRLAMMESFRNLDSVAISVVLSDAYRKSDGAAERLLTEIAGRRSPLTKRRQRVRPCHGHPGPVERRQEECARHGKR